jgi:hypothetical protein
MYDNIKVNLVRIGPMNIGYNMLGLWYTLLGLMKKSESTGEIKLRSYHD